MKNQPLRTMVITTIVMVVSALSAHAQGGNNVVVKIPFQFAVSGKVLPAGQYVISRSAQSSPGDLMIRSEEGGAFAQTKPVQIKDRAEGTRIIFKRYGDQYFLHQIWVSGRTTGREFLKSKTERELDREYARRTTKPETLAVKGQAR